MLVNAQDDGLELRRLRTGDSIADSASAYGTKVAPAILNDDALMAEDSDFNDETHDLFKSLENSEGTNKD
jgi:hypothetical protein